MATARAPIDPSTSLQSWFDTLTAWIDRGPAIRYAVYAFVALVSMGLMFGPSLLSGAWADLQLVPFHLVFAFTAAYMLFFMHATKGWLASAHEELRDLLDVTPDEFSTWRARITNTPAGPTIAIGAFGGASITMLLLPLLQRPELGLFATPVAGTAHFALLALTSFVIATYLCRAAYRMVWTRRLHETHLKVDLLRPEPLFAQTGVLARGGLTLMGYSLLWILTAPGAFEHVGFVVMATVVNVIAVSLYVAPLLRFHRMLAAEKRGLIVAAHERSREASNALHEALRSHRLDVMDPLSKGLAALQSEVALLERLSTWPWHPELSRVTVTALLVPTTLWVIQRILQGWL